MPLGRRPPATTLPLPRAFKPYPAPDPLFDLENAPAFTPRRSPSPIAAAAGSFSRARRLPLADASLAPCAAPLLQSLADSSTGQFPHACFSLPPTALHSFLLPPSPFPSPRAS